MCKFLAAVLFIALLSHTGLAQNQSDARQIAAVKAAVEKIGVGTTARVRVTVTGKPKIKGFINEIRDDDFVVISTEDGSIGTTINIRYSEVVKIKGKGVDWKNAGIRASIIGLKSLKIAADVLKGACFGPISKCSP